MSNFYETSEEDARNFKKQVDAEYQAGLAEGLEEDLAQKSLFSKPLESLEKSMESIGLRSEDLDYIVGKDEPPPKIYRLLRSDLEEILEAHRVLVLNELEFNKTLEAKLDGNKDE